VIIFGSVWFLSKKSNQTIFFKSKPVQTDQFRFGLAWFFQVWLGFSGLARFFSIWIQFGFFGFRLIKPKLNRTEQFFKNSNRFNRVFFTVRFFQLFFSGFLNSIGFLINCSPLTSGVIYTP